jgi:putative GTP pyrophosphokinase
MDLESLNEFKLLDLESENNEIVTYFREFMAVQQLYSAAIKEIRTKFEILDDEFSVKYNYNPIHQIESRLKKPKSIIEKLKRKGFEVSLKSIRENLFDVAGIRVICNYVDDIYRIADLLIKQDDITLIRTKDYIEHPKENGYRSLHLIVSIPIFLAESTENVMAEIQIRTIAMNLWASLEHELKYKSEDDVSEELKIRLKNNADTIAKVDMEMQSIFRELKQKNNIENICCRGMRK